MARRAVAVVNAAERYMLGVHAASTAALVVGLAAGIACALTPLDAPTWLIAEIVISFAVLFLNGLLYLVTAAVGMALEEAI